MIRPATPDDAEAIATVSVAAWRQAYADIFPSEILSALFTTPRAEGWRQRLEAPEGSRDEEAIVATESGQVIGFASYGPQRDEALRGHGFDAEVVSLYVDPAIQGHGIGRALMVQALLDLSARGHRGVALWTLRDNAAGRGFYERLGGTVAAERWNEVAGLRLPSVAYAWPSLASSLPAMASTASATIGVGSRQ